MKDILFMSVRSKRRRVLIVIATIVLLFLGIFTLTRGKEGESTSVIAGSILVRTEVVTEQGEGVSLGTVGIVKPRDNIDIVALVRGTVQARVVDVGDTVLAGQLLIQMFDATVTTTLENARIAEQHAVTNTSFIGRVGEQSITQAEGVVANAEAALVASEIARDTANDNEHHGLLLQDANTQDTFRDAVTAYRGYINTMTVSVDSAESILSTDPTKKISGLQSLGLKDVETVRIARDKYDRAHGLVTQLERYSPTAETITLRMADVVQAMEATEDMLSATMTALQNTLASSSFPSSAIAQENAALKAIHGTVVTTSATARTTTNALETLDARNARERDALRNAVRAAEQQLELARVALRQAGVSLRTARESTDQQKQSAIIAEEAARGQRALAGATAGRLGIRAPISGTVLEIDARVGASISSGDRVASIGSADFVVIEVDLPSENAYTARLGQSVRVRDSLTGIVTRIAPTADRETRKVAVEVSVDNTERILIPETLVPLSFLEESTSEPVVTIPLKALLSTPTGTRVYVVQDGVALTREVIPGTVRGTRIEIREGLVFGERVIIDKHPSLVDGAEVHE